MTEAKTTQSDREAHTSRVRALCVLLLLSATILGGVLAGPTGPAVVAANEAETAKAPYYENESVDNVPNETWMEGREDPTAPNIFHFATRFTAFVVGSATDSPGTNPSAAAPMLVGVVIVGAIIGTTTGTGVGSVGGAVIGIVAIYGIIEAAIAPTWMYGIALFALGLVATSVVTRALR